MISCGGSFLAKRGHFAYTATGIFSENCIQDLTRLKNETGLYPPLQCLSFLSHDAFLCVVFTSLDITVTGHKALLSSLSRGAR